MKLKSETGIPPYGALSLSPSQSAFSPSPQPQTPHSPMTMQDGGGMKGMGMQSVNGKERREWYRPSRTFPQ